MAIKSILRIWDKNGLIEKNIEFLNKKTHPVKLPISSETKDIIKDLIDTYKEIPCAGIAANQIGYNKSMFIGMKDDIELDDEKEEELEIAESTFDEDKTQKNEYGDNYEIYINPTIMNSGPELQNEDEGCLSVPYLHLEINRFDKIMVRYTNEDGKTIKKSLSGFLSKLFQHELDHLNGELMINNKSRITSLGFINIEKQEEIDFYKTLLVEYFEKYVNK